MALFPLKDLLDGTRKLSVQLTGSIGKKSLYVSRYGELAAGTEEVVLDTTSPCVIDYLEFATNNNLYVQVRIMARVNGTPTSWTILHYGATGIVGFYPGDINQSVSALFDILLYDTTNNRYKVASKNLQFPEGVKITLRSVSTTAANAGIILIGRELA